MVLEIAKVADDGRTESEQVARLLATCALMISRQQMSSDVSLNAHLVTPVGGQRVALQLTLLEDGHIDTLLQDIVDTLSLTASAQKNHETSTNSNASFTESQEGAVAAQLMRLTGYWTVQIDVACSHAETFEETFRKVQAQLSSISTTKKISQVEMTDGRDVQWLVDNALHGLPPQNPTNGVAMFTRSVQQWPDKVAVEAWDGSLTYSELDQQSTQLAKSLVIHGVKPLTIVPLLFEFSKWVPVALFATWKAGASWVFLDPSHPIERLQSLVARVSSSVALTQARLHPKLLDLKVRLVAVDEPSIEKDRWESTDLPILSKPESPAYLIFTSGSTGEPKAVVHTHLAFCSGAHHQAQILGFSESTRTLENAPLIFAGAEPELLFTLLKGGCLCIPKQEERVKDLAGCVRHFQSNLLILSSSSAAIRRPEDFHPRQRLLIGAEPLSANIAKEWAKLHDGCNAYGSSESNTVATCCPFIGAGTFRSVGRGAAHQYWIVDALDHNRLVPPGWLGEVVVEGHALASGYLGNEEATTKSFPTTPKWYSSFTPRDHCPTRLFKPGDLGRIAPDGALEVHGRTDPLQVKLRGHRIELGEIEAVTLKGLPHGTPLAAELILPNSQERPCIAVFVGAASLVEGLERDMLAEHISISTAQKKQLGLVQRDLLHVWTNQLPEYMVPTYLVPLPVLPRTSTGKLDRRTLRNWSSRFNAFELSAFSTSTPVSQMQVGKALTTDNEIIVGEAISKVLGIPTTSLDSSSVFTVLGGDSLTAIELSHELRSSDLTISPAQIVQSDNLSSLAAQLEPRSLSESAGQTGIEPPQSVSLDNQAILQNLGLKEEEVESVLPTTDSQSRAIELGTGPERCFVFHFVIKSQSRFEKPRLEAALQSLVDRHDILRTLFARHEGRILQVMLKNLRCPLESADFTDDLQVEDAVHKITASNINLDEVPTMFSVLSVCGVPNTLLLRLSHAQFDGLSIHVLWKSLAEIYLATADEKQRPTPPAPRFSNYASAVLQRSKSDEKASRAYFKQLLKDVPFTNLAQRQQQQHQPQNRHLHRRLNLRPVPGFTTAHFFEAAWGCVSARASKTQAAVFDTIISGRQLTSLPREFDVRKLVGACLNDVPVVVRLATTGGKQTLRQLMLQIRDQHGETARHETLGFRTILGDCKPAHWPENARMTSSVQYRGFEAKDTIRVGELCWTVSIIERSMDLEDLTVVVTPLRESGTNEFDVEFLFSDAVVEVAQAEKWFEKLIQAVTAFHQDGAFDVGVEQLIGLEES